MIKLYITEPGSTANRTRPRTLHSIQVLRALAAMLVVLFHGQLAFSTRIVDPGFVSESYLFAFGAVGVHIFFVISGFIMVFTSRFDGGFNAKGFMRRRLLRIYPIYWICAALYLCVHALFGISYDISLGKVVGALLLLPGDAAAIIGPAWTLAFEMFFYLCFAVTMLAGLNRGLTMLAAFFLISIILGTLLPIDNPVWNLITNSLLLEFIAGAIIGWLLARNLLPKKGGFALILISMIIFIGGIICGYDKLPSIIMWGAPSTMLVAGAVIAESGRMAPIWIRRIGHFGDSSYALYLVHILVITVVVQLALPFPAMGKIEPALAAIIIAMLALVIAELLHHRLEKPLLRKLNPKRPLSPVRDAEASR
ncbi:MAG: acyltransferase [Parasphingorhabdus sp.]|uniref:acyltransferase family protein n=1 Tax=Parasphingorhabdus sp. TaxID=2709688 RepID=UPI0030037325